MKKIKINQCQMLSDPMFHLPQARTPFNRRREPAYTSLRLVRVIPAHASGQHLLGYAIVIGNRAAPPARRQLVDGAVLASIV
ncbi:MAG: hypothetical protein WCF55_00700, partial [Pseudolabrys sp.]